MKIPIFEIVEYPTLFLETFGPVFVGNTHSAEDPNDTFGVLSGINGVFSSKHNGLVVGFWKNFKNKKYQVLGVAYRKKTKEWLVIYKALYFDKKFGLGAFWGRSVSEFLGNKKLEDGTEVKRFEYIGG